MRKERKNSNRPGGRLPVPPVGGMWLPVISGAAQPLNRIVLADDDAEDREVFAEVTHELVPGMEINMAPNGEQLMRMLNTATAPLPDVIFLDLNMPLKNGQQCLREIRSHEKLKHIPVVIYSTSINCDYVNDTFSNGANYYLQKPTSYSKLRQALQKMFTLNAQNLLNTDKEKYLLTETQ
jgi:CheY-like chemotaxis protein